MKEHEGTWRNMKEHEGTWWDKDCENGAICCRWDQEGSYNPAKSQSKSSLEGLFKN